MFQGEKALRLRNWAEPDFDPARVFALVLTHTHLDHIGRVPRLVRQGFRGRIYCTPPTRELAVQTGLTTVLVLSGVSREGDLTRYAYRPDHVVPDAHALVALLEQQR